MEDSGVTESGVELSGRRALVVGGCLRQYDLEDTGLKKCGIVRGLWMCNDGARKWEKESGTEFRPRVVRVR